MNAPLVRRSISLLPALALLLAPLAHAAAVEEPSTPLLAESPVAASDSGGAMSGKDIYEKVLDNRFDAYVEEIRMHSGDRGGNVQDTEMEVKYLRECCFLMVLLLYIYLLIYAEFSPTIF